MVLLPARAKSASLLGLAGLISGALLTMALSRDEQAALILSGPLFGITVGASLSIVEPRWKWPASALFVLASTIAFLLALLVAGFFYTRSARAHSDFKELLGILIAGWLGAAILFLAAGLLSRGATQWREAVALAVKWAPVGALVASFAYPVRRIPEWFPIAWEVVVAMAIAWVLPEKTPEPPSGSG